MKKIIVVSIVVAVLGVIALSTVQAMVPITTCQWPNTCAAE